VISLLLVLAGPDAVKSAIGGVIVALLWLYMSSFAILVGAEVNSVIADLAREDGERQAQL
jgi:uncharacterized BrkB/YihY/UPF0761 family membrane protein